MKKEEALELVEKLFKQYELDYSFQFKDYVTTVYGYSNCKMKTITINSSLIEDDQEFIETLKHEISHALTPYQGHNKIWKAKCLEIGCYPSSSGQPRRENNFDLTPKQKELKKMFRKEDKEKAELKTLMNQGLIATPRAQELAYIYKRWLYVA